VLRDGASAQYGSDAIAGVIDLRLREERDGGDATVSYGVHKTSYDIRTAQATAGAGWSVPATISRDDTDGGILTMSAWKGLSLGSNGFFTKTSWRGSAAVCTGSRSPPACRTGPSCFTLMASLEPRALH
jgi:outer membrane receptor protein involved in Fe transport